MTNYLLEFFPVIFIAITMIVLMVLNKTHFPTYVKHGSICFFIVVLCYTLFTAFEAYFETFAYFNYGRLIFSMLCYFLLPVIACIPLLSLRKFSKRVTYILLIPIVLNIFIYLTMLFSKWSVWFDEANIFQRGPLGYSVFIFEGIYAILYVYVIVRIFMEKRIRDGIVLSIMVLGIYFAGAIDVFFEKGYMITMLSITYALYYLYLSMNYNRKYEALLAKSQKNELMLSQIQPHFMYNVLSSIYYLCDHDSKKAKDAVNAFSTYLRNNLDAIRGENIVPFSNELTYCKNYLHLEKIRFDNELNIVYDIDTMDFKLPKFTLQPLVENAVKHGITQKEGGGTIEIYVKETEEEITIGVKDDGVGFQNKNKPDGRSHTGLENIRSRVFEYFSTELIIESELNKGTNVYFTIKKVNEK